MTKLFRIAVMLLIGLLTLIQMGCRHKISHYINYVSTSNIVVDSSNVPLKNKKILQFCEKNGKSIAPTYQKAVCTSYVIEILSAFTKLSNDQKQKINIITKESIKSLLEKDSPITKGVYYSLVSSKIGIPIDDYNQVKAGDFVQFWNDVNGEFKGHCGIVRALDFDKGLLSLYSSSPKTDGHGIQLYLIPKYMYFVRLK